ncbi:TPA: hypothetical protein MAZ91_000094 [Klebsiella pneumoniae]|nr:Uncharacterised protein [Klebsiella pneumoniae]HBR4261991.1 hypothetical protein [Klebsiella pneumoniae]HBT0336929.1 hypothetical protein [Klebsiella pneumoniae]
MNNETVNDLIQSLESAGELSIREQKFLKLAKEFRICSASLDAAIKAGNMLADQNAQLAAENVALNEKLDKLAIWPGIEFYSSSWEFNNNDGNEAIEFMCDIETPATDRIVAGIKADAIDEAAVELDRVDTVASTRVIGFKLREFSQQLREGADK